jgi:hypothetical protein
MKQRKERVTVTVDRALVRVANAAVSAGRASSLSGWVNLALEERAAKERRLQAMADAIAAYEAQFGAISQQEIDSQERADRRDAVTPRRGSTRRVRRKGVA